MSNEKIKKGRSGKNNPKYKCHVGEKFGRLTILEELRYTKPDNRKIVLCLCDCGITVEKKEKDILSGNTKSCGCVKREQDLFLKSELRNYVNKVMPGGFKHGFANRDNIHPLFTVWCGMKQRCKNPVRYDRHAGRGIRVCKEWATDFKSFYDWSINNGWVDGLTIDRKDNDGNYEPNNCRWVTHQINCQNQTRSLIIEYNGITKHISKWAQDFGIRTSTLSDRIFRSSMTLERAMTFGKLNKGQNEKLLNIKDWTF